MKTPKCKFKPKVHKKIDLDFRNLERLTTKLALYAQKCISKFEISEIATPQLQLCLAACRHVVQTNQNVLQKRAAVRKLLRFVSKYKIRLNPLLKLNTVSAEQKILLGEFQSTDSTSADVVLNHQIECPKDFQEAVRKYQYPFFVSCASDFVSSVNSRPDDYIARGHFAQFRDFLLQHINIEQHISNAFHEASYAEQCKLDVTADGYRIFEINLQERFIKCRRAKSNETVYFYLAEPLQNLLIRAEPHRYCFDYCFERKDCESLQVIQLKKSTRVICDELLEHLPMSCASLVANYLVSRQTSMPSRTFYMCSINDNNI